HAAGDSRFRAGRAGGRPRPHPAGGARGVPRDRRQQPAPPVSGASRSGGALVTSFWRVAWSIAKKDLAIEARSRELVNTTVFFAVSCIVVFAVAFVGEGGDGRAIPDAAAGIL